MMVSISGLSGSGKSTLAKKLSGLLNWPHVSAGKYFRDIARDKCTIYELSSMALEDSEIDKEITQKVLREIEKFENCIFDAHGAALIAKGHKQFCIFLHCPLLLRAKRISSLTCGNYSQIKESIEKLDKETVQRFKKIYGQNILDLDHYDLIVNTDRLDIDGIVSPINEFIKLAKV